MPNLVTVQIVKSVKCSFQATRDYDVVLSLVSSSGGYDSLCIDSRLTLYTLINRSLMYLHRTDYNNAVHDLLLAVELSPQDITIHHTLGICYHKFVLDFFISVHCYYSHCYYIVLLVTGYMNTPQSHVIYLLNSLMTS